MNDQLEQFIAHARSKNMDHSTIRMLLLSAGWKEKEIAKALTAETLDMDVPTPPDVGGAREAFLHLLSFAALYTLVISSILLYIQYINRLFPDTTERLWSATAGFSEIRMGIAAMIVAFPLLIWVSKIIHRDIALHPQKAWSAIRRWLTYLTLFIAAATLMIDVITLVFSLLEGELSMRFLLKVLTVFIIAGATFLYYFLSLKAQVSAMKALSKKFLSFATLIVAIAIVWGVFIVGSPVTGRQYRFDETRLRDLKHVHNEVYSIVYDDSAPKDPNVTPLPVKPLPESLEDVLSQAQYRHPNIIDPETGYQYEYRVLDKYTFELCTEFSFQRFEAYDIAWNHPAGRHCFQFDTQKRKYY